LSTQATAYQKEAQARLQLPFRLLCDQRLALAESPGLPTFSCAGMDLYKRLTLILQDTTIKKVFYPVFPPDRNAEQVVAWLRSTVRNQALSDPDQALEADHDDG
jgi:peroxiredoxin